MNSKEILTFKPSDADNSDNVGATLRASDGSLITSTVNGAKKGIDVNLISDITVTTSSTPEELSLIDEASSTVFYFGYAPIGTAESAAAWKMTRLTISGTIIKTEYAGGVSTYTNVWTNRASLTYS